MSPPGFPLAARRQGVGTGEDPMSAHCAAAHAREDRAWRPGDCSTASRPGSGKDAAAGWGSAKPGGASPSAEAQGSADRSVLVVEDNLINQKILVAFLRKRGYEVDVASDGAEAVQRLAEKRYRLVLMDLQMPVLDGFEATRLIRSLPEIADVPIVAVSAHALNGEARRCLEAGMNGYLSKPVEPAELYAWVERFAGAPQAC